jgi:hypothetical protein
MSPYSNQTGYARPPSSVPEDAVATRYGDFLLPVIRDVVDGSSHVGRYVSRSSVAAARRLQLRLHLILRLARTALV